MVAVGSILWAMYEGTHGKLSTFVSGEGLVLVVGRLVRAPYACRCRSRRCSRSGGYIKNWIMTKELPVEETIKQIVNYAEIARRDGMLALEGALKTQQDAFLRKGLQLAMDGTDPHTLEDTLRIEISALAERHRSGKKFFDLMAKFGPGFGLTATLVGQVAMFQNLGGDSASIGKALAVALLGTLYGCLICNVICGPIGEKLGLRSAEEQFAKEMTLVGIMSIQAGDNPHVVQMKLQAFLSEGQRRKTESHAK